MTIENVLAHGLKTSTLGSQWSTEHNDNLNLLDPNRIASGTYAGIPAAGTVNRFYYATDSNKLYYDNGAAWVEMYIRKNDLTLTNTPIALNQNVRTSDSPTFAGASIGDGTSLLTLQAATGNGRALKIRGFAAANQNGVIEFDNNAGTMVGSISSNNAAFEIFTNAPLLKMYANNAERLRLTATGAEITGTLSVSSNTSVVGNVNVGTALLPTQIILNGTAGTITTAGNISTAGYITSAGGVFSTAIQITSDGSSRGIYLKGRTADDQSLIDMYSNNGLTGYGYIYAISTSVGLVAYGNRQVVIGANAVNTITVSGTGVTITGTLTSTGNTSAPQLQSTIATGTAPLTVASTTQVTNLNAQYVGGYTPAVLLARANHTGTQDGGTITGTVPNATNAVNATQWNGHTNTFWSGTALNLASGGIYSAPLNQTFGGPRYYSISAVCGNRVVYLGIPQATDSGVYAYIYRGNSLGSPDTLVIANLNTGSTYTIGWTVLETN